MRNLHDLFVTTCTNAGLHALRRYFAFRFCGFLNWPKSACDYYRSLSVKHRDANSPRRLSYYVAKVNFRNLLGLGAQTCREFRPPGLLLPVKFLSRLFTNLLVRNGRSMRFAGDTVSGNGVLYFARRDH